MKKTTKSANKTNKKAAKKKGGLRNFPAIKWSHVIVLVILVAAVGGLLVYKSSAQILYNYDAAAEDQQLKLINTARKNAGKKQLIKNDCMSFLARLWSRHHLAKLNKLVHNDSSATQNFATDIVKYCHITYKTGAENVGYKATTSQQMFDAFMASQLHKANIMNGDFNYVGIGAWRDSKGILYMTEDFIQH